ncbi:MAG: phytanoyl-CoA dioxygenase family protein [Proteobacteria bacterium]|nr:phytanoyl-CoA dioxygenase family protein [Pseudomonadota bacterium]
MRLQLAESRAWEDDGFFIRPRVFSPSDLEELREAAEAVAVAAERASACPEKDYRIDGNRYVEAGGSTIQFEHGEHHERSQIIRVIEPFHHLHPRMDALMDDPRLVEPMRDLVGSERVALWTDKLNLKRSREGSGFRFHQDSPYWNHKCDHVDQLPNVMIALDDATADNGCLRVVRGSHKRGSLPGIRDETTLGPLFTDPAHFDPDDEVLAEMPAGSLLFFSPHTVHGSQPNRSGEPRRAMVLTYQPSDQPMFKRPAIRNAKDANELTPG